jgi:uncharacterized membrane protein
MADQIQLASLGVAQAKSGRLAYIDWMRGLACALMFQTHCYNSWLNPEARKSALYAWSQLAGTLPAPLFIFLAGISFAMVTQRCREKDAAPNAVARTTIWRGAEIYGLGLLFRVQEFALGYPSAPWTDLLRVDVLNILGLSMMLMGLLCWLTAWRGGPSPQGLKPTTADASMSRLKPRPTNLAQLGKRTIIWSIVTATAIASATPLLWTTLRPRLLPWPLESYINGVHIYEKPQPWLFPLFPWSAFGFVGLAIGFFLFSEVAKRKATTTFVALGGIGVLACAASMLLDSSPLRLYPAAIYDYWHTGPNFFLMRCGILLVILFLVYGWCRLGLGQRGFSPMIQLGNTSLLVYWVHIEFVYGRFSILPKGQCGIWKATAGLLVIFLAMLGLSLLRTRRRKRPARALQARPEPEAAPVGSG